MPARWPPPARRSAASASPASTSAAAQRRSPPSPKGISPRRDNPGRRAPHHAWISPKPCRRHLPRLSKSRRYTARWSWLSPTSTRPFPLPLRARRMARADQTTKAQLAGIIRPRVAGISRVGARTLGQGRRSDFAGERVVLTGGASALVGHGRVRRQHAWAPGARGAARSRCRGCRRVFQSGVLDRCRSLAVAAAGSGEVSGLRSYREALGGGDTSRASVSG